MIAVDIVPMVIVPVTFLFVLLIILIAKAPKTGAWVVGGLVGAGLIIALVVMAVLGIFVAVPVTHRRAVYVPEHSSSQTSAVVQRTGSDGSSAIVEWDRVYEDFTQASHDGQKRRVAYMENPGDVSRAPGYTVVPGSPGSPVSASPIWSDAIEQEFDADVYPSKAAAVRALGSRVDRLIGRAVKDANLPARIVVFQEEHDRAFIAEFCRAAERAAGGPCVLESHLRNVEPGEVGITLRLADVDAAPASRASGGKSLTGRIEATALAGSGGVTISESFVEKPWVENFATVANLQPDQHLVVARSTGTCMSSSEAEHQAMEDARAQLTQALGTRGKWKVRELGKPAITQTDVRDGGFVVDRFVQSFEGSAGTIWRQAVLLDVSPPKLMKLAEQKLREHRQVKMTWVRMGLSGIGVLVLIGVIYFFLNMATRGYYEWSLRIAGVVFAIVAVISVLMIVK